MSESENQILAVVCSFSFIAFILKLLNITIFSWTTFWINWLLFLAIIIIILLIRFSFKRVEHHSENVIVFYDFQSWREYLCEHINKVYSEISEINFSPEIFGKENSEKANKTIKDNILYFNRIFYYESPEFKNGNYILNNNNQKVIEVNKLSFKELNDKNLLKFPIVIKTGINVFTKIEFNPKMIFKAMDYLQNIVKK